MQAERDWSEVFKGKKNAPTLISVYSEIVFKSEEIRTLKQTKLREFESSP